MGLTQRIAGAGSTASGAASILGSWQICHNLCLGLIAVLGVAGITLTGMPLLFFTKIAVPLWIIALALLGVVAYFYTKKRCISKHLIVLNLGLITAGFPFAVRLQPSFWVAGGALAVLGIIGYINGRFRKQRCHHA